MAEPLTETQVAVEKGPVSLPVLALKNTVLFPHLLMPLVVGRPKSIAAVEAGLNSEDKTLVVLTQRDSSVEEPGPDDLFPIGSAAIIKRMDRNDEQVYIVVQGTARVMVENFELQEGYLRARVRLVPDPQDHGTQVEALHREVLERVGQIQELLEPQLQQGLMQVLNQIQEPLHQVYLLSSLLGLDYQKEQALLSAPTREETLRLMHDYLAHEFQVRQIRHKIASTAAGEMDRQQREFVLRQQMRAIQEELGEKTPEEADVAELRKLLEEADLPENVAKEANEELTRLERIPAASPEYQVTRSYVELLLELPWKKTTTDHLELDRAAEILDEDHFDLKDVKERIIEHLAVMRLNPEAKAPILCFVGPPGVGKTSLGQSIARALGRKFERMSLGGLHDEAELRGHRRTYIGAMPGRIIQALRRAGVRNPLLMLDEVDKLGHDYRGDPAAALLEILDPAQNFDFHDNYLDLPFDLSKVFFITTANSLDGIPGPLLDRMETLRLAGYSDEEKKEIARRYLIPRQLSGAGLKAEQLVIPDATVQHIIRRYTREAGVRELERTFGRIARRVATWVVRGKTEPTVVSPGDLAEILGPEKFFPEKMRQQFGPGVATGLAWTENGGEVLYVEAVLLPGENGHMMLTGHLGEVMQESAKAARSYILAKADDLGIDRQEMAKASVHIHVPAGAIPKDGPSAGVTMAAVLASVYTNCMVRRDTAMTGEVTLSGLVLPVGGIKEKVLAAHRAGVRRIILPAENEKDLPELPDHVRDEIEFVFAERIEDVLNTAIPELAERLAGTVAAVA